MIISVVVPVYNVEKYLRRCVKSIIGQTFSDFELLLIDDGSKDRSGAICDEFKEIDGRVKVFHKPNGGLSDARNFGIKKAEGSYLTFIDSDDYIAPMYLETLFSLIEKYDAQVACLRLEETTSDAAVFTESDFEDTGVVSGREAVKNSLLRCCFGVSACGKLFKRSLLAQTSFPKDTLFEDLFTIPYIFERCEKVAYSSAGLYYYYQREGSITNSRITDKHMEFFSNSQRLMRHIDSHVPEAHDAMVARFSIESIKRFAEILLFCPDYYERIRLVVKKSKDMWEEGIKSKYVPTTIKIQMKTLQKSVVAYKLLFYHYKKAKLGGRKSKIACVI